MTIKLHQIKHFLLHFFSAKRNGHGVHSPFVYRLCEEVFYNTNTFYDFKSLNKTRDKLLRNEKEIEIEDFGAGSRVFKTNKRKVKDIALKGISTQHQSELLYKLSNFLECRKIVELGTSLGLNTLYLSKVNKENKVVSIEGSKSLFDFAKQLAIENNSNNIQFIHSTFEDALPEVLISLGNLDLLYVDGNHTYEATLNYFKQAIEKKHNNSVFIFDDIYWSKAMTKAWQEIKEHHSVTLSIDTFYFGMVFFRDEIKEKINLRLFL